MTYVDLLEKYKGNKDSISYNELLSTKEWKLKRNEILKRDSYVCQRCKKRKTEYFEIEKLESVLETKNQKQNWKIAGQERFKIEDIKPGEYWFISEESFKKYDAYKGFKYLKTPSGFILIKADKEYILNVHHKKYILNILPWENYHTDYETYCTWCHLETHENEVIKCYNLINNRLITVKLTPCQRCFGKGILPKYEHIENGICFRCLGKRFEELIEN